MKKVFWLVVVLAVVAAHRGAVTRFREPPLREPVQIGLIVE